MAALARSSYIYFRRGLISREGGRDLQVTLYSHTPPIHHPLLLLLLLLFCNPSLLLCHLKCVVWTARMTYLQLATSAAFVSGLGTCVHGRCIVWQSVPAECQGLPRAWRTHGRRVQKSLQPLLEGQGCCQGCGQGCGCWRCECEEGVHVPHGHRARGGGRGRHWCYCLWCVP